MLVTFNTKEYNLLYLEKGLKFCQAVDGSDFLITGFDINKHEVIEKKYCSKYIAKKTYELMTGKLILN